MSRRVHSTPVLFGALLFACAVFSGCNETTDNPFGPTNPGAGTGGSVGATTTMTQGTLPNPYTQGGAKATGGAGAGLGGTTAGLGSGGALGVTGGATAKGTTSTGTGGAPIIIGTTGKGGTGSTTTAGTIKSGTGTEVTFSKGKGVGAMLGYGYVAMGSAATVTSPTCGTAKDPISATTPCKTTTNWAATDSLCISGELPANPDKDYLANWGMSVGLNATDPAGGGLGQAFTSIAIAVTGAPTGVKLVAQIHKKGDPAGTSYGAYMTSAAAIPLTSFATDYFEATPKTKFTAASAINIDKVSVQVSSSETAAITVTDLCITGITFQ